MVGDTIVYRLLLDTGNGAGIILTSMRFKTRRAAVIAGKIAMTGNNPAYLGFMVVSEWEAPVIRKYVMEDLERQGIENEIIS